MFTYIIQYTRVQWDCRRTERIWSHVAKVPINESILYVMFFLFLAASENKASEIQNKPHKRVNELKMPDITRPNGGGGKAQTTLKEQLNANLKYLKKLQVDMDKQVHTVNQEFIDQQPIKAEHVNQTKKYPNPLPEDELERLMANAGETFGESNRLPLASATPFSLPKIVHHVLDPNSMGNQKTVIEKDRAVKKALHPDSAVSSSIQSRKDLIGNMNIKGNMDQLKKLMKTMANDVQESNVAIVQRQKDRHEKEMEKLTKDEKKNKAKNEKQQ